MKGRARLLVAIAAPLMLVNLSLFVIAWFIIGSTLIVTVEGLPSFWPMTLVVTTSAALYIAGLVFIAADALEDGIRGFRNPKRMLNCSLLGLGMNSAGALLGFVVLVMTLAIGGAFL